MEVRAALEKLAPLQITQERGTVDKVAPGVEEKKVVRDAEEAGAVQAGAEGEAQAEDRR